MIIDDQPGQSTTIPVGIGDPREGIAVDPKRPILVFNATNPFEVRRRFFRSFSEDQRGHALPGFATYGELSSHQERPRGRAISFLNRASQVRVLPGAPKYWIATKRLRDEDAGEYVR